MARNPPRAAGEDFYLMRGEIIIEPKRPKGGLDAG
jgi:hypothetical protein